MKTNLLNRFLRYVKMDTRSDGYSSSVPSTSNQFELAKVLVQECKDMGLSNVRMSEVGIVMATLPSNTDKEVASIGFIAHMDTADYNSVNVSPRIIENYDGGDIELNPDTIMTVDMFPSLKNHVGKTLVVTDGTTLLGADDKAGIANIMSAMEYLLNNPELKHGDIHIAFTIDEEIGTGADSFDVSDFGADFAYTIDGGAAGGLDYETFNAAGATVRFKGVSVHPGSAKDTMINANIMIMDFMNRLPKKERPELTDGYDGFYLVTDVKASIEDGILEMIIRDHDRSLFEEKKSVVEGIVVTLNEIYGEGSVTLDMSDSYYNMADIIMENIHVLDLAKEALKSVGLEPVIEAVRGGTDGSKLSYMGLPTPNLFTGGENFHGKYEFAVVESMVLSAKTIVAIATLNVR